MSGIEIIRETARRYPDTDIMVVTMFGDEEHVLASIEAGATGYLLKDSLPEELIDLIKELRAGGSPISPIIARQLLKKLRPPGSVPEAARIGSTLSARESEILSIIAKGFSFAEIARLLAISPHTVTTYVKKIYQKLAVHSRGEAVYEASRTGPYQVSLRFGHALPLATDGARVADRWTVRVPRAESRRRFHR